MNKNDGKPSTWRQALSCFAVYHFSMALGASTGFSGVALPQLQDEKVTGFTLTESQVSWFASLQIFATIPTSVLGGTLGQCIGSKYSLKLIAPLLSFGFICQALAEDYVLLLFGRFVCGAAGGLTSGPTVTYVSEASTPNLRTCFGSGINGSYNFGLLIIFTLGAFCHWRVLAWVSAFLPLMGLLWLRLIPESPAWFVTQGRYQEAKESLAWLRGEDCDTSKEFLDLKESYQVKDESENSSVWGKILAKWKQLRRPDVSTPFCIILIISFLQQFSGIVSITYYGVSILSEAGSTINIYLVTILFGLMRFISQVVGSLLLIKFKRRHLMVVSCLFLSLAFFMLGSSFFLHDKYNLGSTITTSTKNQTSFKTLEQSAVPPALITLMGVLPMISVCLAAFMYSIGLGPIPWSYMAELFPLDVRSFMSGVGNCVAHVYTFLAVKMFHSMTHTITIAGVYWFYSGISVITILFTCLFLPETKGKTLQEISTEFKKRNDDSFEEENVKSLPKFDEKSDKTNYSTFYLQ